MERRPCHSHGGAERVSFHECCEYPSALDCAEAFHNANVMLIRFRMVKPIGVTIHGQSGHTCTTYSAPYAENRALCNNR